jgi:single-stranded-DNA-specific exonuclease
MLNYNWKYKRIPNESAVEKLAKTLKLPKSLANVLVSRGFETESQVKEFFEPSAENIHDPYLFKDMEIAVNRIIQAISKKELIWIHGDYDVDGTTSTSMILQFLRRIGAKVDYYIPDRFQEGYGLTVHNVDIAKEKGVSVILTVDVGVTSVEALAYAKQEGMDAIICDHHEPGEELPEALAILDPFVPGCTYPFKHLAACGVTFKLIQAIAIKLNIPDVANEYLDFVAIGSAADMVPMIGENRTLAALGLKMLNQEPRPGIKGLIYCTNIKLGHIATSSIIYSLAPLINAAGRLGSACRSVEMMSQSDEVLAFQMAQQLEQENRRRRIFDEKTFEEAIPMAEAQLADGKKKSLFLYKPDWHAGVIGIVASRLVDRFHVPTILLTSMHNMAKGSARSIMQFDVHSALKELSRFLYEFGGHKHAAGLSMKTEYLDEFAQLFDEIAQSQISNDMIEPELNIDAELFLHELSPDFIEKLKQFAPFGYENYKPVFMARNVSSKNGVKIVGSNHLKFRAQQSHPEFPSNRNMKFEIDAIAHNLADKINYCTNGKKFSIVFNLEEYNYNGHTSIQLRIKDIQPDEQAQVN